MKKINFIKLNRFIQKLFIKVGMNKIDAKKISTAEDTAAWGWGGGRPLRASQRRVRGGSGRQAARLRWGAPAAVACWP